MGPRGDSKPCPFGRASRLSALREALRSSFQSTGSAQWRAFENEAAIKEDADQRDVSMGVGERILPVLSSSGNRPYRAGGSSGGGDFFPLRGGGFQPDGGLGPAKRSQR